MVRISNMQMPENCSPLLSVTYTTYTLTWLRTLLPGYRGAVGGSALQRAQCPGITGGSGVGPLRGAAVRGPGCRRVRVKPGVVEQHQECTWARRWSDGQMVGWWDGVLVS